MNTNEKLGASWHEISMIKDETIENIVNDAALWSSIEVPKYVGGWRIGGQLGFYLNLTKKPNWFHRFMMKLLLGIEWLDN